MDSNNVNGNAMMWRVFRKLGELEEAVKIDDCNLSREAQDRLYYKLSDLRKVLEQEYKLAVQKNGWL